MCASLAIIGALCTTNAFGYCQYDHNKHLYPSIKLVQYHATQVDTSILHMFYMVAHTYAVVKSLACNRTAFYTCSERQDEQYVKMTALNCSYRLNVQWLHQAAYRASGSLKCAASCECRLTQVHAHCELPKRHGVSQRPAIAAARTTPWAPPIEPPPLLLKSSSL